MTNIDIIKRKISEVEKYLKMIFKYKNISSKKVSDDEILRGAIERHLYLLCQSTIDLGEIMIAYLKLRTPSTYAEIFEILEENSIIDKNLALKMKKMTGLRNILAHAYGEVNLDIVLEILQKDIGDFLLFLQEAKTKIS